MIGNKKNIPSVVHLTFKKGEMIIKEGDFGISVYKVIKGKVGIYSESGTTSKVALATLGRGEVLGEMTFLHNDIEVRSASAIALEDSELEVWHPKMLESEYERMPPMVKYITNQSLNRLVRMNKLITHLASMRDQRERSPREKDPWAPKRAYYRKDVDLEASYRQIGPLAKILLKGRIKDISMGGMGLEVSAGNAVNVPHNPGDKFTVSSTLPNGKEIDFRAKIEVLNKEKAPGKLFLGMNFIDMSYGVRKELGFFLMP
ncbi:MAG: cyclic nucleotide-binding domain-containing protein [Desulfatiglans sp.]|jgi:hypothetical protein|nr:cyclic nucleotide-binding domain-containing protein [Thermodesulfobacteriota bacterium]MEE4353402.1 cyclic nucleotide-binding domain-containing protein [Desulfatiglans sp.]